MSERRAAIVEVTPAYSDANDIAEAPTREVLRRMARTERLQAVAEGKCPPVWAVATRTTRNYGGPEEGGRWFDWTDVLEVRRAWGFWSLLWAVRALCEEYPTDPRGRHSVLGNQGDVTIYLVRDEQQIERLQDRERPRYE